MFGVIVECSEVGTPLTVPLTEPPWSDGGDAPRTVFPSEPALYRLLCGLSSSSSSSTEDPSSRSPSTYLPNGQARYQPRPNTRDE